ncbi:hypothetical protein GNF83_19585, partial [Clostridium perfringens]|nr:hypothetical protein [Clostridium perfringens]
ALLGELLKAIIPHFAPAQTIFDVTVLAMRLTPMVIGVCIAMQFKLTPIQTASVGMATVIGSGVAKVAEKGTFVFAGTGDVINAFNNSPNRAFGISATTIPILNPVNSLSENCLAVILSLLIISVSFILFNLILKIHL